MQQLLELLGLQQFDLDPKDIQLGDQSLIVTKWNWEYSRSLDFQRSCVRLLQDFPSARVHILCSHPHVFTNGRGLQKPKKGEALPDLKDFTEDEAASLPFPLIKVERGGGLTFHHPGQVVYYPIRKLHPAHLSLSQLMDQIFDSTIAVLNDWGMENLEQRQQPLGLWQGSAKLASMGIAIERLTTFHGLALNLRKDESMWKVLRSLNPCGLNAAVYTSVEELLGKPLPANAQQQFAHDFLKKMQII